MPFTNIDQEATSLINEIRAISAGLKFNSKFTFILDGAANYQQHLNQLNFSGVYLIEIRNNLNLPFQDWYNVFQPLWSDPQYIHRWVPNIKQVRVNVHLGDPPMPWIPIYIGKSQNIRGRINGHIDIPLEQPTTALKLRARLNLYGQEFRISTININVNNYDLIVSEVEKETRNRYSPILGKQ